MAASEEPPDANSRVYASPSAATQFQQHYPPFRANQRDSGMENLR